MCLKQSVLRLGESHFGTYLVRRMLLQENEPENLPISWGEFTQHLREHLLPLLREARYFGRASGSLRIYR